MTTPIWSFPWQSSGLTDYHSIPTESALDSKLETFVREVLQNANDQGLSNGDPVEVTFEFNLLTGRELDEFLNVLDWNSEDIPGRLQWHVEQAIKNDQARDPGLKRFLNHFEEDKLLVLTIHDENTTGLRGSETDKAQPYGALVKDFGSTEKPDSSSGGSHGLGKTVLWAFSGISTVLFNSSPDEFPENGGEEPPRLVGRTILPAHEHEDDSKTYTNHGWFGRDDETEMNRLGRPPSLWGDEGDAATVAESLHVDRPSEEHGTSIGVVGFRVPGESFKPDLKDLATEFRYATAKYFWPAIVRDELEVYVKTPTGGREKVDWEDAPEVKPFIKCYEQLFNVTSEELSGPGTFAKKPVELTVPRENPDTVDTPHGEYDTSVDLMIRSLSPGDRDKFNSNDDDDLSPNRVARLRGAQMIVDYVPMESAAKRGTDFAAVLVCGEAQANPGESPSDEQKAVEQFLKRSEPTQHDDWQGSDNDYLKKHYVGTIVGEVNALKGSRLEARLADVVQEDIEAGNEVPGMDDVAPVMDGHSTDSNGAESALKWDIRPDVWFGDGKWYFFAEGGPAAPDHGVWTVEVELVGLDGQGHEADKIPIDSFEIVEGAATGEETSGVGQFEADADTDQVTFQGESVELDDTTLEEEQMFDVGQVAHTKLKVSAEVEEGTE